MNAFVRHHSSSIRFAYSCFDRMVCNAYIQPFLYVPSLCRFLIHSRQVAPIKPASLRKISADYHEQLGEQIRQLGAAIVEPPARVRREEWLESFYQELGTRDGIAVVLRCRERARVAVSYPSRGHEVELAWRYVNLYYVYLQDAQCGRLFLRLCPYFPFNNQVWLNGHEWLARQLQREGIGFVKRDNAFVDCAAPERLQELADSFRSEHIDAALEPWFARLVPFFTAEERAQGYRHRLFMAQMEYCHNLIFHKHVVLERLFARLLDVNRSIGHPEKLAIVFGRPNLRLDTRTGQTVVKITQLKTSVLRTGFQNTFLKQYVKDRVLLRTETTCQQLRDLSVRKDLKNLPRLRQVLATSNERYLEVQQDVLASWIDRGQLEQLREPTVSINGRRTPGLRLDDPRLLALLQALTCFTYLVGKASFRTKDLLGDVQRALNNPDYKLSQLRYDLAKLRGKGLVVRLAGTQRYQLTPEGYRIAVLYTKLYQRLYAPLTAAILNPVPGDNQIPSHRRARLDRLYVGVDQALHRLSQHVGLAS
jgi:hypothetical protein